MGSGKVVKANANTQIDMFHDKTSAKDKRKQRQELEKSRRDLAKTMQQQEQNTTKAGVRCVLGIDDLFNYIGGFGFGLRLAVGFTINIPSHPSRVNFSVP